MVERKIFVFWSGDNPITEIRSKNLQTIRDKSGCEVGLVTPQNLNDYIVEPFHEAYQYLSVIHRTDYLKAYFAYHHGCGYSDIKECNFNWEPYFKQLEENDSAELISYSENGGGGIALRFYCMSRPAKMEDCQCLLDNAHLIPGVCHYIFKKHGDIAKEWRRIQHEILDNNMDVLVENPGTYHIGAVHGGVFDRYRNEETKQFNGSKYPFCWSEFGGMIYHELTYKHHEKCIVTMPTPTTGDHWK